MIILQGSGFKIFGPDNACSNTSDQLGRFAGPLETSLKYQLNCGNSVIKVDETAHQTS